MTGHTDEIDPKTPRILAMTYQMVLISHFSFLNLGFHTDSAKSRHWAILELNVRE